MFKSSFFLEGPEDSDPFRCGGTEAAEIVAGCFPGLAGYTQTRTLADQVDPSARSPYTGVAEFWFAEQADALAAEVQGERLVALLTGETQVGASASGMIRTVMRTPSFYESGFIKGVFPFRRRDSLSVEAFQRYWWLEHGPVAALTEGSVCYTQCHPPKARYASGRPPFDGITELYWPDVAAARAAMGSRQMVEVQAADARNFAEPDSVVLFLAGEEVVIAA